MEDNQTIQMTITLTASTWGPPAGDGKRERTWDVPREKGSNAAARIERKEGYWPFTRWEWSVWSIFNDEAICDGSAGTEKAAMREADEALRGFIAGASTRTMTEAAK